VSKKKKKKKKMKGVQKKKKKKKKKKCFLLEIPRSGENLKKKSTTTFSPRCLGHPKGGRVSGGQFGVDTGSEVIQLGLRKLEKNSGL
jgi:hypothetical protein